MIEASRTDALRPETLEEFAGQPALVRELGIVLSAAKTRKQLPDHVLLSGGPGLGKTSLANIIANELEVPIVTTSGPALERPSDAVNLLSALSRPSVVFVDEIHRMPRIVEETFYPAMEDGVLDFPIGEGSKARSVRLEVVEFVLVGATTQAGLLSAPLRDRFGFLGRLALYDDEALATIVERSSRLLGVELTRDAALMIASRARATPRVANRLLRRVRDVAQVEGAGRIDAAVAQRALEVFEIDALGLDVLGRMILSRLCEQFRGGPVGVRTLAASVNEAPETLEAVYEPYLMHRGLIARTPRGRVATEAAYSHLGLAMPAGSAGAGMQALPWGLGGASEPAAAGDGVGGEIEEVEAYTAAVRSAPSELDPFAPAEIEDPFGR